ncbi:MAG: putative baseplate assembly protein [Limisphaerales bacterium]
MPITAPILDDRSYQQLRDELVRRIAVYTPEWTNHNPSDPGITLIELFAFLGENLLYRFNQIPEATRIEFLRLLQIPLRAAQPARALVAMTTDSATGTLVPQLTEARAGALAFETRTEVHAWPVSVVAVARVRAAAPDPDAEPESHEYVLRTLDALGGLETGESADYYQNQLVSKDDSEPPVDFGATVDGMLWVAVLAEKNADKSELADGLLNLGFVPDAEVPSMADVDPCPGDGLRTTGPAVEWQITSATPAADGQPRYITVKVEGDSTRGLSQEGVVRIRLPRKASEFGVVPASDPDLLGAGDRPPALDDETEAKVLFWLRAFRHDGSRFGKVRHVAVNATEVFQRRLATPQVLGTGNAQPGQEFALNHAPILAGSLRLEVEESGVWSTWTEVDGFHASGPEDRHFVVDLEAARVRFGNGLRGSVPQIGQRVRALEYRYGGGSAGNVASGAITKLPGHPSVKVSNPIAAYGGADTETLESALDRIPGELRRRDRAVTADDFRELALATPGANVGRAECLPRFHPPTRTGERAGIVSVVIWPTEDKINPGAPRPERNLLRSVCEWLDQRRLVTTELYVIPPTYRKVAVAVGLQVKDGYGIEAVRNWVELVIRQYLAPLPPYGPEGQGWPLGRRVHGPELEAAALQVEGVEFLEELTVAGWDETQAAWIPGTVELEDYEVPELTEIAVVEGPLTFAPGDAISPPPAPTVPVPIPVLREEC